MNSPWSNVKLKGQLNSEFDEFAIHGKLMKIGIQRNQNQVIWNYNQRDILFSRSEIFRTKNYEKNEEHYELLCKIKDLNLIKIQITSW